MYSKIKLNITHNSFRCIFNLFRYFHHIFTNILFTIEQNRLSSTIVNRFKCTRLMAYTDVAMILRAKKRERCWSTTELRACIFRDRFEMRA